MLEKKFAIADSWDVLEGLKMNFLETTGNGFLRLIVFHYWRDNYFILPPPLGHL
jgi:hypothetical protein